MRSAATLASTALMAACATHQAPSSGAPSSKPRITWELRAGGDFGDSRFVCGSSRPAPECALEASATGRRSTVSVELYLHPSGDLTNYSGVMRLPFIQGWSSLNARDVSASIPAGSRPVQTSVSGLVTTEPGQYTLRIALDTVQEGTRSTDRLTVDVPVTVKAAALSLDAER